MSDILSDFFDEHQFGDTTTAEMWGNDLFSILESLDGIEGGGCGGKEEEEMRGKKRSWSIETMDETETSWSKAKRVKNNNDNNNRNCGEEEVGEDGLQKMSHITVERNRRKQMNEHLSVLRSLMPFFYVKRGDQASIIGGVIDYINELQQVLQSLEAKKQRKIYTEILSPRPSPLLSPKKPPLSPRINLPISPKTPQSKPISSPNYKPYKLNQNGFLSPTIPNSVLILDPSPSPTSTSSTTTCSNNIDINELVANAKSGIADVEVKFSGPNLIVKTVSPRFPGQALKIISALEQLSLEILNLNINTLDDQTMLYSFTIKIGIECQLSAEELAHRIQQTFC